MTTTIVVHPAGHIVRVRRYDLKTTEVQQDTILLPGSPPFSVCVWDGVGVSVEEADMQVITPVPSPLAAAPATVAGARDGAPE